MKIDINELVEGSDHFSWGEVLLCRQWGVHVFPTKIQHENLLKVVAKAELIRDALGLPMVVTSGLRPRVYNRLIGGAKYSAHIEGKALDFVVEGMHADMVRASLEPLLSELGIRMEKLPGANWIHIDIKTPGGRGRYFDP